MKKIIFIVFIFGVLIILFLAAFAPLLIAQRRANRIFEAIQTDMCKVELTPGEIPGNFWEKHRFYLETPSIYQGSYAYVIQDARTGAIYYWSSRNDVLGHTRFSVLTRFALFYRDWKSSDWILLYKC